MLGLEFDFILCTNIISFLLLFDGSWKKSQDSWVRNKGLNYRTASKMICIGSLALQVSSGMNSPDEGLQMQWVVLQGRNTEVREGSKEPAVWARERHYLSLKLFPANTAQMAPEKRALHSWYTSKNLQGHSGHKADCLSQYMSDKIHIQSNKDSIFGFWNLGV